MSKTNDIKDKEKVIDTYEKSNLQSSENDDLKGYGIIATGAAFIVAAMYILFVNDSILPKIFTCMSIVMSGFGAAIFIAGLGVYNKAKEKEKINTMSTGAFLLALFGMFYYLFPYEWIALIGALPVFIGVFGFIQGLCNILDGKTTHDKSKGLLALLTSLASFAMLIVQILKAIDII